MSGCQKSPVATLHTQRVDKWLWFTRVVKTRGLAARTVQAGKIRVNKVKVAKPSYVVRVGDVITVSVARRVRVLRVTAIGWRRGPASEAKQLYEDLTPIEESTQSTLLSTRSDGYSPQRKSEIQPPIAAAVREPGSGRPTKRDRRQIDKWQKIKDG